MRRINFMRSVRLIICEKLKLKIYIYEKELPQSELLWIIPKNSIILLWSQFINSLSPHSFERNSNLLFNLKKLLENLNNIVENDTDFKQVY